MGNVKFNLGFDNRVQPGAVSCQELIATLQAQGVSVNAANPVKDPITGKLIAVELNLPDTAAQKAIEAIAAHGGVASSGPALPTPLLTLNLSNIVSAALILEAGHRIFVRATSASGAGAAASFGELNGDGVSNTYTDGAINSDPVQFTHDFITLSNPSSATPMVIPASDLTLTSDGSPVLLANTASISVAQDGADIFYIDAAGLLYRKFQVIGGSVTIGNRSYEEAVAAGAV